MAVIEGLKQKLLCDLRSQSFWDRLNVKISDALHTVVLAALDINMFD